MKITSVSKYSSLFKVGATDADSVHAIEEEEYGEYKDRYYHDWSEQDGEEITTPLKVIISSMPASYNAENHGYIEDIIEFKEDDNVIVYNETYDNGGRDPFTNDSMTFLEVNGEKYAITNEPIALQGRIYFLDEDGQLFYETDVEDLIKHLEDEYDFDIDSDYFIVHM